VAGLVATAVTAAGVFAGTNLDDLVVLAALFLAGGAASGPARRSIWVGQAAGFTVLLVVSMVAAFGLAVVPVRWVGLLGVVPLVLGVRGLVGAARAERSGEQAHVAPATGLRSVMALTIVNGADNLTVYPPVFRTIGAGAALVTVLVFAAGVVVWCLLGAWLGSHGKAVEIIGRWGQWIIPAVFVAIGAVIVLDSGLLTGVR
jgi:cadmium resistance protein CadD (predicted permease)